MKTEEIELLERAEVTKDIFKDVAIFEGNIEDWETENEEQ